MLYFVVIRPRASVGVRQRIVSQAHWLRERDKNGAVRIYSGCCSQGETVSYRPSQALFSYIFIAVTQPVCKCNQFGNFQAILNFQRFGKSKVLLGITSSQRIETSQAYIF